MIINQLDAAAVNMNVACSLCAQNGREDICLERLAPNERNELPSEYVPLVETTCYTP